MSDVPKPSKGTVRYLLVSLLAISLQGIALVYALEHSDDPVAWVIWVVALIFCAVVVTIATRRSVRLAQKARRGQ